MEEAASRSTPKSAGTFWLGAAWRWLQVAVANPPAEPEDPPACEVGPCRNGATCVDMLHAFINDVNDGLEEAFQQHLTAEHTEAHTSMKLRARISLFNLICIK